MFKQLFTGSTVNLSEVLRIKKKASDKDKEKIQDNPDQGKVGKYRLNLSKHSTDNRGKDKRNKGLTSGKIHGVIEKFLNKESNPDGYTHLIFKNSEGKWDDMLVFIDNKRNVITIVTVIKHSKEAADDYFIKRGDKKSILESLGHEKYFIIN